MNKGTMFSSVSNEWETPDWLFKILDDEFHFTVDLAATKANAKVEHFYSPQVDSLTMEWRGVGWLNPPYSRQVGKWVQKSYETAVVGQGTVVMLLAARTDTRWWWNWVRKAEVRFLKGRLKFGGGLYKAPFPSAVVVFRKGNVYASTEYWDLGEKEKAWREGLGRETEISRRLPVDTGYTDR